MTMTTNTRDMTMTTNTRMTRREFFETLGKGSLVVGFSLSPVAASLLPGEAHAASADSSFTILSGFQSGPAPGADDAWLTIDHQGNVTLFSGKVELGTGTQTAFSQIVAEELNVDVSAITYVQGDTSQTPDEGTTAGSQSILVQGPLVRAAAATAYQALLNLGSGNLGSPNQYGKLFNGQQISLPSNSSATVKDPSQYTVVGQPVPRVDLFSKFTGKFTYVSDIVVPGMLHGRVVRNDYNSSTGLYTSKSKNAMFQSLDDSAAQAVPGFVKTIQNGNFVGVVATTEWGAIQAARGVHVTWGGNTPLVSDSTETDLLPALKTQVYSTQTQEVVGSFTGAYGAANGPKLTDTFYSPYHMHGSVGPCCAVANVTSAPDANGIQATVWSGTQGVYPLQAAVAQILGISQSAVRIIYVEGAGCYGHNGADDVAVDAALMSQAVGKPVRVQWMRQDEHGWEPLGPAMLHTLTGALNGGAVAAWMHEMWTPPHNSRPGGANALLAGQETGLAPPNLPTLSVNAGTRNAPVNYLFPAINLTSHNVQPFQTTAGRTSTPVVNTLPRSSALRSLGGLSNCFANESFMDELAIAAGADPIAFRRQYVCILNSTNAGSATAIPLKVDPRAQAALDAMAKQAGWGNTLAPPTRGDKVGKGVAFARYDTELTYLAVYAEVEVTSATGAVWVRRVVVAHDCGLIINPDGLKNQIEGNVIQGISRTLIEEVQFNHTGITSLTWAFQVPNYPVIHFNQVPASIEIVLVDNAPLSVESPPPGPTVAWGAGEPTIGPVAPAIANAIFNATGKRMTILPITPQRILSA